MMTIRRNLEYECLCQMINKLIEQLTGRLSKACQYALFFCFVFLGYLLLLLALKVNFIKNVLHDIFGNLLIIALAQGPYGRVHLARHGQVFRREFEMRTKVEPRAATIEHRYGGEVAQLAVVWHTLLLLVLARVLVLWELLLVAGVLSSSSWPALSSRRSRVTLCSLEFGGRNAPRSEKARPIYLPFL